MITQENNTSRKGKKWTEEEDNILQEMWGSYNIRNIAKALNRTTCGVQKRVAALGLGHALDNSSMIRFSDFLKEFGITNYGSGRLNAYLKAGFPLRRFKNNKRIFYMVNIESFWEFAEKNTYLFDFSKLEPNAFGKEPEWMKEVRKTHYQQQTLARNNRKTWSEYEVKELVRLSSSNFPLSEIATRLGRTDVAIISQ